MSALYVAFKGNGNSGNKIVRNLSGNKLFLTNSYSGLKKDIDHINGTYDFVYMFGLDKTLKGNIRIECVAKREDVCCYSDLDFQTIAMKLNKCGINTHIGNTPIRSLCNEAYWYMLRKCNCHALFFHVPSIKYITEEFMEKVRTVFP
ncbi:MAG: hypothetical protein K2M22_05360 [Lachnospiraceae bacterium]|nr:hypothetical protein [Lachnospiraceae bacterium]MDE7177789.1 hypothetical protein [Lachnospiraceae bacterium]